MASAWRDQIPRLSYSYVVIYFCIMQLTNLSFRKLQSVVEFEKESFVVNPSRVDPSELSVSTAGSSSYLVLPSSEYVTLTMAGMTFTDSNLFTPKEYFSEPRYSIEVIPHNEEFQRMEAVICQAFRVDSLLIQKKRDAVTFMTAKEMKDAGKFGCFMTCSVVDILLKDPIGRLPKIRTRCSKNQVAVRHPDLLEVQCSRVRALVCKEPSEVSTCVLFNYIISPSVAVPVLDGRNTRFDVDKDLRRLDQILPEYTSEIPAGSCVWVGFTCNKYKAGKGESASFNLMWVVLLGIPGYRD